MMKKEFYDRCADILGVEHEYSTLNDKMNTDRNGLRKLSNQSRWGGREPGNGRFPGFGTIRMFGPVIHMTLTKPTSICRTFANKEDVFKFLEELIKTVD